jgi:hypothetical protein
MMMDYDQMPIPIQQDQGETKTPRRGRKPKISQSPDTYRQIHFKELPILAPDLYTIAQGKIIAADWGNYNFGKQTRKTRRQRNKPAKPQTIVAVVGEPTEREELVITEEKE